MRGSKYKDSQSDLKSIEKLNRVMQARLQYLRTKEIERWKSNSVLYLPREGLAGEVSKRGKGFSRRRRRSVRRMMIRRLRFTVPLLLGFLLLFSVSEILWWEFIRWLTIVRTCERLKACGTPNLIFFFNQTNIFVTFTVSKSEWTTIIDILPLHVLQVFFSFL